MNEQVLILRKIEKKVQNDCELMYNLIENQLRIKYIYIRWDFEKNAKKNIHKK